MVIKIFYWVHGDPPEMVADAFKDALENEKYKSLFDTVTFAIYCPSKKEQETLRIFKDRFTK